MRVRTNASVPPWGGEWQITLQKHHCLQIKGSLSPLYGNIWQGSVNRSWRFNNKLFSCTTWPIYLYTTGLAKNTWECLNWKDDNFSSGHFQYNESWEKLTVPHDAICTLSGCYWSDIQTKPRAPPTEVWSLFWCGFEASCDRASRYPRPRAELGILPGWNVGPVTK